MYKEKWLSYIIVIFLIITSFASCKKKKFYPCLKPYTISNLFKDYDSSRFKIEHHKNFTKVYDTIKFSQQGFYKFDKYGTLVKYEFLQDWGDTTYTFGIKYDSLGNVIDKKGSSIANWFIGHEGKDSLVIMFFLYKINNAYAHIILSGSDFSAWISLEESMYYSNMLVGEYVISKNQKKSLIISGVIGDECSNERKNFTDSLSLSQLY